MSNFLLIDAYSLLHRAFHALPELTDKKGQRVELVYGLASMLISLFSDFQPSHCALAWDLPQPTFRHQQYPPYQAHRPPMDEAMKSQLKLVRQFLKLASIAQYAAPGYEADDIIGTLAQKCQSAVGSKHQNISTASDPRHPSEISHPNCQVVIVTGDKDIWQLITPQVFVWAPLKGLKKGLLITPDKVEQKLGVSAQQVIDYKALVGDPSDGYPGVRGIGPKTAVNLLSQYQSLNNIYSNLEHINPSIRQKLEKYKKDAYLSQKLATIITNVPNIEINWSNLDQAFQDVSALVDFFQTLGFKSLLRRFLESKSSHLGIKQAQPNKEHSSQMSMF